MNQNNFISIRLKLVLLLSATAFLAIFISSMVLFTYTFFNAKDSVLKGLSQLTTVIGQNLVAPLEFDDKDAANLMLNSLKDQENIKGAYIFKGVELFTSYIKKKQSKNLLSETILYVYDKEDKTKFIKYVDTNDIVISFPIYSSGELLGTFCLVSDTSDIKEAISSQAWTEFITAIFVLIIIILLALSMQKYLTKNLFVLSKQMQNFTQNKDLSISLKNKDINDEFASIYSGFNLMIHMIKSQEEHIKDLEDKSIKSVKYASLIQKTIRPKELDIKEYFQDYFSLLRSKEKSSNKVYLFDKLRHDKNECLMVLIDCRDSGQEGSFETILMRAIERFILAKIKYNTQDISPSNILKEFNEGIKNISNKLTTDIKLTLGFTGAVLYFDKDKNLCKFAGSHASLIYTDDNSLSHVFEGDQSSLGYSEADTAYEFTEYELQTKPDMQIYLSSQSHIQDPANSDKNAFVHAVDALKDKTFAHQKTHFEDEYCKHLDTDDLMLLALKI